jgi:hypothetical protein
MTVIGVHSVAPGGTGKAKDDLLLTVLAAITELKISNTELKTETRDLMKEVWS